MNLLLQINNEDNGNCDIIFYIQQGRIHGGGGPLTLDKI